MLRLLLLAALAAFLSACARRAPAPTIPHLYNLEGPRITPDPQPQSFEVPSVRGPDWKKDSCGFTLPPLSLTWHAKTATVSFPSKSTPLEQLPGDRAVEQFRLGIRALEDKGCLRDGGAARVLDAIAQNASMTSRSLYMARYGLYFEDAAIDVEPSFRLKVVGPLVEGPDKEIKVDAVVPDKPGTIDVKISANVIGFETSYYRILPAGNSGVRLELESVEQNRKGVITQAPQPSVFDPLPPNNATHLRLLFLRRVSKSDRDITLIGASSPALLRAAVARIEKSPDPLAACRAERAAFCRLTPRLTVISVEAVVTANGKTISVPVGGTVFDALRTSGIQYSDAPKILPTLRVERPYAGRLVPVEFDRSARDILSLALLGGEVLSW